MAKAPFPVDPPAAPDAGGQQQVTVRFEDADADVCYANFCRVSRTLEEIVLDVGLNPAAGGAVPSVVKVDQRIVMNPYTAKRLVGALSMALRQHEETFGPLELDPRKRVVGGQGADADADDLDDEDEDY